jgi:hypothetical protein
MRKYLVIFVVLFLSMNSSAQLLLHHPEAYFAPPPGSEKYFYDLQDRSDIEEPVSRIRYSLDIGTMLSSFRGNGSMVSTYLSPSLRYRISPKFEIQAGGTIIYDVQAGSVRMMDGSDTRGNNPSYQLYLYGVYQVSDRLVLDGSVVKTKMNSNLYGNYPYQMNSDFESYSFGFNYRIAKSVRIGAHINVSNGMNPYYYSDPFHRRGTYHTDPFYRYW